MPCRINRQVLLVEKPTGKLGPEHFRMTEAAIPKPNDGEALLRVRYISLDAANRAWMHGATYRAAIEANTVMAGGGIAEVLVSNAPGLAPGDIVFGDTGWQDYAVVPARHLQGMPKLEPMTHLLRGGFQGAEGRGARRHRRLFRQCRRRHSRSLPGANEQPRPHCLLRRDLAI